MDSQKRMTFWDVSDEQHGVTFGIPNDPLVLDAWRHRQVNHANYESFASNSNPAAFESMSRSLMSNMDRNRGISSGISAMSTSTTFTPSLTDVKGDLARLHTHPEALHLGNISTTHATGLSLDANLNSVLQPQKTIAELSARRRDAIRAAFHRLDTECQGYVKFQDLTHGLQRFSQLSDIDQERLARSIAGNNPHRITFGQFVAFYQLFGSTVERDSDFEDLVRKHWGFPSVSDMFDDMKNKLAMLGVAYAFRKTVEVKGSNELSMGECQEALAQVGIQYSASEFRRMFDAFEMNGDAGSNQTLDVTKFAAHLTSAPRPQTPVPMLLGSAHFSEVGSVAEQGDLQNAQHLCSGMFHSPSNVSSTPGGFMGLTNASSLASLHPSLAKFPEPEKAQPSETPWLDNVEHANPNAPPPEAPDEKDDEGVTSPPENMINPNEPPPDAPEEEDEDALAPDEPPKDDEEQVAPLEKAGIGQSPVQIASMGYGTAPHNTSATTLPTSMNVVSPPTTGHLAAVAAAGNPVGRKRAVTVGINYIGTQNELAGCINDSDTFIILLTQEFGFQVDDIRQLRDDHPKRMPTRKNITSALTWLVNGARAGDHLFFHYSGHGSQQQDVSGDEMDGKDETLVPCDFRQSGMLSDDHLRRLMVSPLPKDVRLTVILDCCHSGTAVDLPFKVKLDGDGKTAHMRKKLAHKMPGKADGDVVLISGCMDSQTSADIGIGSCGNTKAAGAMTTAFKTVITASPTISYLEILQDMRRFLKSRGFQQIPQLSSEHFLNLTECFMPEVQPPSESPPPPMRPPVRKALTIGINYLTLWPGRGRLSGCINDSETMIGILKSTYGFADNQIVRLRDDRQDMMPTKANIIAQLHWLVQGAGNGDELFLHYSGHGGQKPDKASDEKDGKDETILPCDFETAGQITDDEIHGLVVDSLPKGARMWVIMDCCHSGTVLDLQFKVTLNPDGSCAVNRRDGPSKRPAGEVIMISGCKDSQTSADISGGSLGTAKSAGAMTTAFRHAITSDITCQDLLLNMRHFLKRNNFQQVPQMSSDQFVQLDTPFLHYQMKKRGKRELPPSHARALASSPSPSVNPNDVMSTVAPHLQFNPNDVMTTVPLSAREPRNGHSFKSSIPDLTDDFVLGSRINRLEQEISRLRTTGASPSTLGFGSGGFHGMMPSTNQFGQGMHGFGNPF